MAFENPLLATSLCGQGARELQSIFSQKEVHHPYPGVPTEFYLTSLRYTSTSSWATLYASDSVALPTTSHTQLASRK